MAFPGCSLQGELGWSEVEMAGGGLQGTLDLAGAWIGWRRGQGSLVASPPPHRHPLTLFMPCSGPAKPRRHHTLNSLAYRPLGEALPTLPAFLDFFQECYGEHSLPLASV